MTPTERLYEVALALASKQSQPPVKVRLSNENAKGITQVGVEWAGDSAVVGDSASKLYDVLCAKYPRENGTQP